MRSTTEIIQLNSAVIKNAEYIIEKTKLSPYDERLSTCKEPKFMKYVRNWEKSYGFVTPILWKNSIWIVTLHSVSLFALIYALIFGFKWQTYAFSYLVAGHAAGFGVTAAAHRYWTHRSFKAKTPLRVIFLIFFAMSGQNTIYEWVRDHRVHHKFSETSADPHNANRGFFFSHVGWLMMKKHPDVLREGKKIDLSDVEQDPLVQFHTRYYQLMKILCCWVVPTLIVWLVIEETLIISVLSQVFLRYALTLNSTWCVNSFAHLWGSKPYDPNIMPSQNRWVSIAALGEGWHNYHHTFPWDYKAAEYGMPNNLTNKFLDLCAKIGWAYDLKEASPSLVKAVSRRQQKN